ncbi:MAG TPA: phosphate-starvation-inducible PsiE family protein [Pyrinomonadaceae bacterium]
MTKIERRWHIHPRKYLDLIQDLIVLGLCVALFAAMLIKLVHLGQVLVRGTDFSEVIADILFILVLIELFRLLIIYLDEHRISVSTMVEVGIVSTLREVILTGAMHVDWRQMLVVCAFILTLGLVLRYAGVRLEQPDKGRGEGYDEGVGDS